MADIVSTQILENGPSRMVVKFTNFSDGSGETGVKKVDATADSYSNTIAGNVYPAGVNLKVIGLWYDIKSMSLRIQWDASSAVDMLILGGFGRWPMKDMRGGFQGLTCPVVAGATGSILFTTVGAAANSSYTVMMEILKGSPQQ